MNVVDEISPADILEIGLFYAGFDVKRQKSNNKNSRRFRSHYGIGAEAVVAIIVSLSKTKIKEARLDDVDIVYLLMTLNWMTEYTSEDSLAGRWTVDETTVSKWIWTYATKIQALKKEKVRIMI